MTKILTIKEGRHYPKPFPWPKFMWDKTVYEKELNVKFTDSCVYYIGFEDQMDVNKLFGISYGLHHKNSDRIGWRYNVLDSEHAQDIELVAYSYENGKRIKTRHLAWSRIGEFTKIKISCMLNKEQNYRDFYININDSDEMIRYRYNCKGFLRKMWYTLGLYFGGNQTAPHDIIIEEF